MPKKVILFAPCAFNLAETAGMVEIAKAIERHPAASQAFDIHFISDGGDFESMIEKHGFALTRMEPRLTRRKSSTSPRWIAAKSSRPLSPTPK